MKKFSVKFFVRTSSENVNEGKIYCRLRMNAQYIDFSINRKVEMKEWNADIGWPTGKKLQTKELQKYLHTIQEKLFERERVLFESKEELTVKSLAADFLNTKKVETPELTIVDLIELHNSRAKEELQSNLIVKATYLKYITTKRYVVQH